MIITIQTVEERFNYIKEQTKDFYRQPIYHVDLERKGCLSGFLDMLEYDVQDYRVHLQDNIILADGFEEYLPFLQEFMEKQNFDMLSLYVPKMRRINQLSEYKNGVSYLYWFALGFFPLQGAIFSKKFVELMRKEVKGKKRDKYESMKKQKGEQTRQLHDDEFVMLVAQKYNIKPYIHVPSLVQRNIKIQSTIGSITDSNHESGSFDKDYITRKLHSLKGRV